MDNNEFIKFPKIPRLFKEMVITEKIDGTNTQLVVTEDGQLLVGSRNRYLSEAEDNHGCYKWCMERKDEIIRLLGPGRHFGEFWGKGIQRGYGLEEKRFSLFNVTKWTGVELPPDFYVVPVVLRGPFNTADVLFAETILRENGSLAAPGFMNPEGVVIFHEHGILFKYPFNK